MVFTSPIQNEQEFEDLFFASEKARAESQLAIATEGYRNLLLYRLKMVNQEGWDNFSNYDAIAVERLGDLAWLFGDTHLADQLFSSLQQIGLENGNHYLHLYLGIKRSSLAVDSGALEVAFELLQNLDNYIGDIHQIPFQEIEEWEKNCHFPNLNKEQEAIIKIRLYYVLGGLLLRLGQFEESLLSFKQGIKIGKGHPSKMVKAVIPLLQISVCRANLEKGDIQKALQKLEEVLPEIDKSITSGNYISGLELAAKGNMLTGNFGTAKTYLEEILEACEINDLVNGEIIALCNLSNVNIYLNQVTTAQQNLQKAEGLALQLDNQLALAKILLLKELAELRSTSSFTSVLPSFTKSHSRKKTTLKEAHSSEANYIPDVVQTDYFLPYFEDKALLFQQLLGNFELEHAKNYLQEMKARFGETDSTLIQNRLCFLQSLLGYYQGNQEMDLSALDKVQTYFKEQQMKPELWDLQRVMGWTHKNSMTYKELQNSNDDLLNDMTNSLPFEERAIYLLNKWTAEEEKLSLTTNNLLLLSQQKENANFFNRLLPQLKLFKTLDKLLIELEKYKSLIASKVVQRNGEAFPFAKRGWIKRLLTHPLNRLEIHFLILPDRALVIYSGFMYLKYSVLPINRIEIRELVQSIHKSILSFNKTRGAGLKPKRENIESLSKKIKASMRQIASMLQLPDFLDTLPTRIKRLSIIPDDALHGLPFVLIPHKGKFLIETFAVSINCKPNSLKFFQRPRKKDKKVLLVGLNYQNDTNTSLPGVLREIESIEKLLANDGFYVKKIENEEVTKHAILANAENIQLLHIACHGIFNSKNPDLSGLQLLNEELLSLRDIWQNPQLAGINHITLSSCWAADNFILPNKWILSLPETFLRAGVNSVLACYWEVSDNVAGKFMESFYRNLNQFPRDIALQKTQLLAIKNNLGIENEQTNNFFYWAGFNLYGNSGFID